MNVPAQVSIQMVVLGREMDGMLPYVLEAVCVIPDLIDETKPTSYVSRAGGCWEVLNGVVAREWFYSFIRYVESSKVFGSACKLEFEGIQYDASFPKTMMMNSIALHQCTSRSVS